ncbi:MAG: patatin-like phospholipase family protein [Gammaproteobacteria bacterium]
MPKRPLPDRSEQSTVQQKTVSLALQGGGAHGAFTWGVLDRLLEDERLVIDGISGTSAGAMNGTMLVYGMAIGGRAGAREMLQTFWRRIAECASYGIFQPTPLDRLLGRHDLDRSPLYWAFDAVTRVLSPYQLNPTGVNPLGEILSELVDFDRPQAAADIKLFVCATNVRTGKIRVFQPHEISVDALLASACLPTLFRAVEIESECYWDGGFMGNPAMFPLLNACQANDIILIEINPIRIEETPTTARAIIDRMKDISFNATMMREMRTIAFVTQLLEQHRLTNKTRYRRILFHMIEAEREIARFGVSSKLNADWDFLTTLFELGRSTAAQWLDRHYDSLGNEPSMDLQKLFF